MSDIIIDTSVLIDILVTTRPRRSDAKELGKYLVESQVPIRVPFHAFFEIGSALKDEKRTRSVGKLEFWNELTEENSPYFDPVPIDQAFFLKYYSLDLPYMKAGDAIFVAMAKVDGAILITEDKDQYKKARALGVDTCRIREFLGRFVSR